MNVVRVLAVAAALAMLIAGCGGQNRSQLATQAVKTYWGDVTNMHLHKAYLMLTPGTRQVTTESDYSQSIVGLLKATSGISYTVGSPKVNKDFARVPVTLHSPVTTVPQAGCQHLYWQDNKWLISDSAGGLSPAATCKG